MCMGPYEMGYWLTLCWLLRTCMHVLTALQLHNNKDKVSRRGVVNEMKGSVRATYTKTYNDSNDLP
jgi:hypothetical protein